MTAGTQGSSNVVRFAVAAVPKKHHMCLRWRAVPTPTATLPETIQVRTLTTRVPGVGDTDHEPLGVDLAAEAAVSRHGRRWTNTFVPPLVERSDRNAQECRALMNSPQLPKRCAEPIPRRFPLKFSFRVTCSDSEGRHRSRAAAERTAAASVGRPGSRGRSFLLPPPPSASTSGYVSPARVARHLAFTPTRLR